MDRRGFLAAVAGVVGAGGGGGESIYGTRRATRARGGDRVLTSESATNRAAGPGGEFRDTRAGLTDPFSLSAGLTTLDVAYPADATISVDLVAADDLTESRKLVADNTGREAGTAFVADSGEYRIAVATSGPWRAEWTQPTATVTDAIDTDESTLPPQGASGVGPAYFGPVLLARTTELSVEDANNGRVVVTAYTANGDRQRLVDTDGETERWTTTDLNGAVWFDIAASGEWAVEVS